MSKRESFRQWWSYYWLWQKENNMYLLLTMQPIIMLGVFIELAMKEKPLPLNLLIAIIALIIYLVILLYLNCRGWRRWKKNHL